MIEQSEADKDRRMIEASTRIPDDGEFDVWAEESGREMVKEEPW